MPDDEGKRRPTTRAGAAQTFKYKTCLRSTIADVLRSRPGFKETESDTDWDFLWADIAWMRENYDGAHFEDGQRLNHFRNHYELTRKDLMVKNLKRAKRALEREDRHAEAAQYEFFPPTHVLPMDYRIFVEEYKRNPGLLWIAKPIGAAQGRGIFLFNKLSAVTQWKKDAKWTDDRFKKKEDQQPVESYVVSRYISNPYLVGGKKFDLRLYVLVTCYSPLTVWMYRAGFARFSKWRYNLKTSDLNNNFVHLTNVAVQKTAPGYDKEAGCKWDLHHLKLYMISKHGQEATNRLFYLTQMLVLKSLLAVQKSIMNDKHCFELYGYDVLIDDTLKPWLIEVNASPSLTADTSTDHELKCEMLDDMLDVIDIEGRRSGTEEQIGGFDLIYSNGIARAETTGTTMLGCFNNRAKHKLSAKGKKKKAR